MKKILLLSMLAISTLANAQGQNVGISNTGNSPDPSAMLDVESSTKGLLIPRLALTQTTVAAPVVTPATSLMVYNTSTVNDVTPGYYYWDGSKWERLMGANNVSVMIGDSLSTNVYPLINNLNTQVTTLTTNLATTNNNVTNLTNTVNTHINNDLDTVIGNEHNLTYTLVNGVLTITDGGGPLSVNIAPTISSIINDSLVTNVYPLINTNTTNIANLTTQVTTNTNNISTLTTNLNTTNTNLTNLTTVVNNHISNDLDTNPSNEFNTTFNVTGGNLQLTDGGGSLSVPLSTINSNDWHITGNSGTNSSTNFLGTLDNNALTFRVNNTERWQISTYGSYEPRNTNNSIYIGASSGNATSTGINNVFLGVITGVANTNGSNNVFLGSASGSANTTGSNSIFIGASSGGANTTASQNVFIGSQSGALNQTGNFNVGIGHQALQNSTTTTNTAIGHSSLRSQTTGNSNTAVGYASLSSTTTGTNNTVVGTTAMNNNVTGTNNVAVGAGALGGGTAHNQNVGIGSSALSANTGLNNIAIGFSSNSALNSGNENITIGSLVNSGMGFITRNNSIAIGHNSVSVSNEARLGTTTTITTGGYTTWSNVSDARFKTNVTENVPGLSFIQKLRPVTYNFDVTKMNAILQIPDSSLTNEEKKLKESIVYTGFIAQEVEKAAQEVGYDFSGVMAPNADRSHYMVSYSEFVIPLVKSVQELYEIILMQQKQIDALLIKTGN